MLGYLRGSTQDQDYVIEVQRQPIVSEAERRGREVEWIVDEGETGKSANRRGLTEALARLDRGEADALVVSKLDRLSRSVVDFGIILRRATRPRGKKFKPWGLVAIDVGIDMTTPTGRLVAPILITVAEWEGNTISDCIKQALAVAKRERGIVPGAASKVPRSVVTRIKNARTREPTLRAMADRLNHDGIPSAKGGLWSESTVQHASYTAYTAKSAHSGHPERISQHRGTSARRYRAGLFDVFHARLRPLVHGIADEGRKARTVPRAVPSLRPAGACHSRQSTPP